MWRDTTTNQPDSRDDSEVSITLLAFLYSCWMDTWFDKKVTNEPRKIAPTKYMYLVLGYLMVYYIALQMFLRAQIGHENMYTAYTPYSTQLIDTGCFICMMAVRLNSC